MPRAGQRTGTAGDRRHRQLRDPAGHPRPGQETGECGRRHSRGSHADVGHAHALGPGARRPAQFGRKPLVPRLAAGPNRRGRPGGGQPRPGEDRLDRHPGHGTHPLPPMDSSAGAFAGTPGPRRSPETGRRRDMDARGAAAVRYTASPRNGGRSEPVVPHQAVGPTLQPQDGDRNPARPSCGLCNTKER